MKITLDSTILVRAFEDTGGLARNLLFGIVDADHGLVSSNAILAETSRVLRYPRMRARHRMSDARIAPIRDANDIVIIQTALVGGAEAICTTDEDFFAPPAAEFLRSAGIAVYTDAELMRRLRS